jgi:alcohol dehydrogenase class IV
LAANLIRDNKWVLFTSPGWISRGLEKKLTNFLNPCNGIYAIDKNPSIDSILSLEERVPFTDTILAIGGGSVIDTAKAVIMKRMIGQKCDFLDYLESGANISNNKFIPEIIAIPTTSGSGAEVTRWGTIWGKKKYSVEHEKLYPRYAILDPTLCCSLPADETLYSALDTISHSMESVWNKNHSHLTDNLATLALRLVLNNLEKALKNPHDLNARKNLQTASFYGGLLINTTKTALAHALSYFFTIKFGLPHGLASSFMLHAIANYNLQKDSQRLQPIADAFECNVESLPYNIASWLKKIGIQKKISKYMDLMDQHNIKEIDIHPQRAANNWVEVNVDLVKKFVVEGITALY